jgi:hypothetical protein
MPTTAVRNVVTIAEKERVLCVRRNTPKYKIKITIKRNTIDFDSSIIDFT